MAQVPDVMPMSGGEFLTAARLCNFSTGQAFLLAKHHTWLQKDLLRAVRHSVAPWIDVVGYASKLGDANFNMTLSGHRCESVKRNIRAHSNRATFNVELHKGESESMGNESNNDGYWRSVDVYVWGKKPPVPVRPPPAPIPALGSMEFEIRVVGGGSASIGVQADNFFFQIVDLKGRKTAFFFYTGVGMGISIPKIPGPGSMTKAGPPSRFVTARPVQLHSFNSKASLYQDPGATIGSWSYGGTMRLSLKELTDHDGFVGTRPGIIPIEGGPGIQMPGLGSSSEGTLALVSQVLPFTGY
ncbi:MAG: hypothetical protein QM778_35195 [Myxococcales bacterium]